jgi:EAL domain-containing protein (putative c-di-GMP-specific phosphodiesterase class I)
MESEMRTAIEKNQMRLYCQPMVNHAGNLVGGEILLRWFLDGQESPVMPNDFIPLAESSALIIPIGDWVIEQSLQYLKKWQSVESAKHLKLSINLSARQFSQPSFVQNIKSLVEQYGVDPKLIKLELTESSIIQKLEEVIPKLNELNEFGIQFSLDDFGTGFSSLAYLKILPISQVKIDQSFVRDISTDANDAAIVSAIVAICQSLDLEVVAEGVENQSQIDFLYEKGCHLYQGFHFGKPVPIDHFIS